jgi:hypothetical protein
MNKRRAYSLVKPPHNGQIIPRILHRLANPPEYTNIQGAILHMHRHHAVRDVDHRHTNSMTFIDRAVQLRDRIITLSFQRFHMDGCVKLGQFGSNLLRCVIRFDGIVHHAGDISQRSLCLLKGKDTFMPANRSGTGIDQ